MSNKTRRTFLKESGLGVAGAAAIGRIATSRAAGANDRVVVGLIGDVLVAKAWNVQRRSNIGHAAPSDPPPGVDYDAWVGPASSSPTR